MSERSVYAIASGKGGVGKTTTAINLGAMLADRGYEVVVVDTDLGMANLADFLEFEIGSPTLQAVLAGDADAEDAIHRAPGGIDVLPSATDIEAFARSDPANLEGVVADLRATYDYVLLDTGAGVSYDVLVPLALADGVLLVATPDVASVRDTAKTGKLAERVESEVVGAVLTQRSSDILNADDVEETLGTDVLGVVPEDEAVPMGIDAGRPLAAFAPNAPAGQAYRELAAVLTGEADPDPELDLGDGEVDVEFDAEPPRRASEPESESPANRPTDEEVGENVRDAIGRDDSEGLLGGELASAAQEIRKRADRPADESGGQPGSLSEGGRGSSSGGERGGFDSVDGEGGTADTEGGTTDTEEGTTDTEERMADSADDNEGSVEESEPRSVDDLIDEHMDGDRLGGDDRPGGDDHLGSDDRLDDEADSLGGDDPLAEMGDDPLAGMDDDPSDAGGESESPTEGESPEEVEGSEARRDATDTERASDERSNPDTVPFEEDGGGGEDANLNAESDVESGSVESENVESGDVEAEGVKTGTLSDEEGDGSSGILGRLGSLFK